MGESPPNPFTYDNISLAIFIFCDRLNSCKKTEPISNAKMAKIKFTDSEGNDRIIEADDGISLMEAAVRNGVAGIIADCCGACTCATCHVYVDDNWKDIVGSPEWLESEMLDLAANREGNSRLSCQIQITKDLDGLVVVVPTSNS
jgi:2Fe-2S ferredoxin